MRILILVALAALVGSAFAEDKPAEKKPQFKPPAGYKVKILEWDIVYCRKTPVLGSRFPKEICMTEAELKEHMAANEEMRRNKDQSSRVCAGTACD
jgi:hypothetical protein